MLRHVVCFSFCYLFLLVFIFRPVLRVWCNLEFFFPVSSNLLFSSLLLLLCSSGPFSSLRVLVTSSFSICFSSTYHWSSSSSFSFSSSSSSSSLLSLPLLSTFHFPTSPRPYLLLRLLFFSLSHPPHSVSVPFPPSSPPPWDADLLDPFIS